MLKRVKSMMITEGKTIEDAIKKKKKAPKNLDDDGGD